MANHLLNQFHALSTISPTRIILPFYYYYYYSLFFDGNPERQQSAAPI